MSSERKTHVAAAEAARDWILEFFAAHPVFVEYTLSHYSEITREGIGIQLRLSDRTDTYATAYFTWDDEKETVTAGITMVESGLGQSTGFFLFHLQLLLAVLAGATEITLDNDTDDPIRARQGIYKLFKTNVRGMNRSEQRRWAQMPEKNQLGKPEMVHLITRRSLGQIQLVLLERIQAQEGKGVWRADAGDTILLLFRALRQRFDVYSGGSRRRGSRRRGSTRRGSRGSRGRRRTWLRKSRQSRQSRQSRH